MLFTHTNTDNKLLVFDTNIKFVGGTETELWEKYLIYRSIIVAMLELLKIKAPNCIFMYPNRLLDLENL